MPLIGAAIAVKEKRSVAIIRALMDSVEYTSDPREGTQLVMIKRVSS